MIQSTVSLSCLSGGGPSDDGFQPGHRDAGPHKPGLLSARRTVLSSTGVELWGLFLTLADCRLGLDVLLFGGGAC